MTVLAAGHPLPDPNPGITVPIGVVLVVLAVLFVVRKLLSLALLAVVVAAVVFAYQAGAFDHWVDKGKQIVRQNAPPGA